MDQQEPAQLTAFLSDLRQSDGSKRLAAVQRATQVGNVAILPLGHLLSDENPNIAKSAREAIRRIVHHAARPGASAGRKVAESELIALLRAEERSAPRKEALFLLGLVGEQAAVAAIAPLLQDNEIGEFARLALERIPGSAAENALRTARTSADEPLRAALAQSLRHRKTKWREIGATGERERAR